MDDGITDTDQQRLFLKEPSSVEPPEPGLYLGTSGWSYSDWEGTLYSKGLAAGARLSEYVSEFATVEIDSTFYGTPRRSTVRKWREVAPAGFLFAAKFPREISHDDILVNCEPQTLAFVETMRGLGDKLGPLLLQMPPYFEADGMGVLEDFLDRLPRDEDLRYAVEVRHRSWTKPRSLEALVKILEERGIALTLVDFPKMPRLELATAPFSYVRWLGDRREFPEDHTGPLRDRTEDLEWWAERIRAFIGEGREVFAYANNHYQNHSPSTLADFLSVYRGLR